MKTCQESKERKCGSMDRREFFKKSFAVGAAVYGTSLFEWIDTVAAQDTAAMPDLVAIKNGEPDVMFDKAIEAMGGIGKFVQKGQTVVVKPNIGWNRGPETAANTNPLLVKRIVEHCLNAGAKKVYVFDHGVDYSVNTYKTSGIEEAAKAGGAIVVPSEDLKYYQKVTIPGAEKLKEPQVHEALLEAEVLINVPVLKHHFASQLTIAMKNTTKLTPAGPDQLIIGPVTPTVPSFKNGSLSKLIQRLFGWFRNITSSFNKTT